MSIKGILQQGANTGSDMIKRAGKTKIKNGGLGKWKKKRR